MDDNRASFILDSAGLDERRLALIESMLRLTVTSQGLKNEKTDGYASHKSYKWEQGEIVIDADLYHTDGGIDHLDLRLHEYGFLVFHVTADQRYERRALLTREAHVLRDIQSYWEVVIRFAKP